MNKLSIMILATVALCVAAWVASQRAQQQFGLADGTLLLPQLQDELGQVDRIEIIAAGNDRITLIAQEGQWQVEQKDHYPADMQAARKALRQLAEAKTLEAKTSMAAQYNQLGVQDVDLASDTSVQLSAKAGDKTLVNLIIGKPGSGGSYVRKVGDSQSWLINTAISLPRSLTQYLDKSLVSIARDDVQSVAVTPLQGPSYRISKTDDDEDDFTLTPGVPDAREVNTANVNRLAAALSNLRISDVMDSAADELEWSAASVSSFDGLQLQLKLAKGESNKRYLKMQAETLPDEDGETDEDVQQQAERINEKTEGRIFLAPQYSADALAMTHEMMLKPVADGTTN